MNRLLSYASAFIVASLPSLAGAQTAVPANAVPQRAEDALGSSIGKSVIPPVEGSVHEVVKTGAHEGGGLPQFNTHTWPSQIFWLTISFMILYFFFSRFILPSMTGTFTARENKIEGDIKIAEALSAQAEQIRLGYETELKKASGQASSDMKAIDEEAKVKLAKSLADFRDRSDTEIEAVETRLEQSKQNALADMQKIAAEIAAQAAEKIAGIPADRAQAEDVVQSLKNKAA